MSGKDYIKYYLSEGGDLNNINPDDLANAFRRGYIMAIQDSLIIVSKMPFQMNLEIVKDQISKLRIPEKQSLSD